MGTLETLMDIQKEIETLLGCADDNCTYGQLEVSDRTEEWMRLNSLKMNGKKMKFILFGNNRQLDKCTTKEITIGEHVI